MPKIKIITFLETIFKNKGTGSELWKAVNDLLKSREQEITVFCTYIKHKINGYNKESSLLAMDLVDFCVDNGQMPLWSHLASKDFLGSLTTNLKTRNDTEIQSKLLFLIEKWANKFSNIPELSNFQSIYLILKDKNVQFPCNMQSEYKKYVKYYNHSFNNNDNNSNNNNNNNISYKDNYNYNNNCNKCNNNTNFNKKETDPETYLRDINLDLNTSSYEKKYKRLVNKLYDWTHDIHEINVLINKNMNGINNNKISGLIKDLSKGNKQLIETIESGKLKDETLMNISLKVASDINMTIERWSNHKKGIQPNPFISSFFQDENGNNNIQQYNNNINNNNDCFNIFNSFDNINSNYKKTFDNKKSTNYDINNFYNVNNTNINNNNNNNNNCFNVGNNNGSSSFNLLIDFDCAPPLNNQNINFNNNNANLNLNDNNNNMNDLFNFISQNEKQNQFFDNNINFNKNNDCNPNNNYNNININNINFNNFNSMNNYMNINNKINFNNNSGIKNFNEKNDSGNINNNDNFGRQSLMYPSFEELDGD